MNDERRGFLKRVAAGAVVLGAAGRAGAEAGVTNSAAADVKAVDRRTLGRVGAEVSVLGLGLGSAFTKPYVGDPESGRALLRKALTYGINYWDTARDYKGSEEIMGPVVAAHREEIFLVSKTHKRDYDGFMRDLEQSLELLQTDHLDLYHIHQLEPKRDTDLAVIERGAVRAARKARDEGTIRAFGVTGHSSAGLMASAIRAWDPDAVLTIFPCTRPENGRYEEEVLPLARERDMGIIAMKTVRRARGADLKGTDLVRYAMSLKGVHSVIVGLDTEGHLDENARMAADFKPMSGKRRAELHRDAALALRDMPAIWTMPWYEDGVPS